MRPGSAGTGNWWSRLFAAGSFATMLSGIDRPAERHAARMAMLAALLGLLTLWGATATIIWASHRSILQEESLVLDRMVGFVEEQTRAQMTQIQSFLSFCDIHFRLNPDRDPRWDSEFLQYVDQFRATAEGRVEVFMATEGGELISFPRDDSAPPVNVADRDYFRVQVDTPQSSRIFIGKPYLGRRTGMWSIPISFPLSARPGGMPVVMAALFSLRMELGYENALPPHGGSIALYRHDGVLLNRAPVDDRQLGLSVADSELWTRYLPARSRGVVTVAHGPIDDGRRLIAYSTMEDYPLVVVIGESVAGILRGWYWMSAALICGSLLLTLAAIAVTRRLLRQIASLAVNRQKLENLAQTDELTGLYNRRHFILLGNAELGRAVRYRRPLSLLCFDLDHFKRINDRFGHAVGDDALRWFAGVLKDTLRASDIPARIGGEEFSALLPETGPADARRIAARIHQRLAAAPMSLKLLDSELHITTSIGVAWTAPDDLSVTLDLLLERGDSALYEAKRRGRNQTVVSEDPAGRSNTAC